MRASTPPKICSDDQMKLFARWMHAASVAVPIDAAGVPRIRVEISPLFAVDEDSFDESWAALKTKPALKDGLVL